MADPKQTPEFKIPADIDDPRYRHLREAMQDEDWLAGPPGDEAPSIDWVEGNQDDVETTQKGK